MWDGPDSPGSYHFGSLPDGATPSPEGIQREAELRALMHQEGIPKSIGDHLGKLFNQAVAHPPTDAQLEQIRQEGAVTLHKVWGEDYEKNMSLARSEYQRLSGINPKLPELLTMSGLGSSPYLITALVNVAKARKPR